MSLLIIEDDPALLKLLRALLKRLSIAVDGISDGMRGLQLIETGTYRAVILDLMLPGMNGFDILRSLRATHPHLLSRVIILTAASRPALEKEFALDGAIWKFMRKPFDIQDLTATVSECLQYHGPRRVLNAKELSAWLDRQRADTGATGALLVSRYAERLELRCVCGFPRGVAEQHFPLPCAAPYPICASVRTGEPSWLPSFQQCADPLLPVWKANNGRAMAAAPLRGSDLVTGAIGFTFSEPQRFEEPQRRRILAAAAEGFTLLPPEMSLDDQPQIRR